MESDDAPRDVTASTPSFLPDDFKFAFDDSNFSDRILRIEIVDGEEFERRSDDIAEWSDEQIVSCKQPQPDDDGLNGDDDDNKFNEEPVAMTIKEEPSPSGDEAENRDSLYQSMDCSFIHVSSPILAAKSPFFYKLFSNGMRESKQRVVTLRMSASEEAAFVELLDFMYSNTLSVTSAPEVLDVLMAADKFEVASCLTYCSRLLRNLPMTLESALLYLDLDLPSSILMAEAILPLTKAAKQFLATRYRDITKYQQEVMELPLVGIEAVLSSADLLAVSEDAVYDFIVKWTKAKYPKGEERRKIMGTLLIRYIRFPFLSYRKLKKVLTCNDIDHRIASNVVVEALFFKAESPGRQRTIAVEQSINNHNYIERAYKYRPVKVVEFEIPRQQCVVYLDLKREECAKLFPSGRVYSEAFIFGGQGFFLSAHCSKDQQNSFHFFGLYLGMRENNSVSFAVDVDYELAARTSPTDQYISKIKGNYTFTGSKAVGLSNFFGKPWTSFMADDSPFFINGVLHLRADITNKS